jgi:hypothetical protein
MGIAKEKRKKENQKKQTAEKRRHMIRVKKVDEVA